MNIIGGFKLKKIYVMFFCFILISIFFYTNTPTLAAPTTDFTIDTETPANQSTGQIIPTYVEVSVEDDQGNNFNVTMACNVTGSWVNFAWWNNTLDGTFDYQADNNQNNGPFLNYETKYFWRVTADSGGYTEYEIFHFTTRNNQAPETIYINLTDHTNGSTNVAPGAECGFNAEEKHDNLVNITVSSNQSGSWVETYWVNFTNDNSFGPDFADLLGITPAYDTTYYFRINVTCGQLDEYSEWFKLTTRSQIVPDNPYPVTATLVDGNSIDIQWTKGANATRTVALYKTGSYPTSATDGTEVYNNTGSNYTHNSYASNYYYKLYSFHTGDKSFSSGVEVYLGTLDISVFDELTGAAVTSWDVHVTNADASQTYDSTGNSNPTVIDVDDVPNGDNSRVLINRTGYRDQVFVMDLPVNTHNSLNAYICQNGFNNLYLFQVNDEVNQPIKDALITIRRYMSTTDQYENVSITLTDGAGQSDIYLVPNVLYHVQINKTGYVDENTYITPDPDYFGYYYPKTFVLVIDDGDITPPIIEPEDITIQFYFAGGEAAEVRYNFSDPDCGTTDLQVYSYVVYPSNGTQVAWGSDSETNDCSITGDACSNTFPVGMYVPLNDTLRVDIRIIYHYNHTTFGHQTGTFIISRDTTPVFDPEDIGDIFDDIFGPNPMGWINFLMFIFFVLAMFYADQRDYNVILIFIGGSFIFLNVFIGFNSALQTISGGVIPILFIVVGILGMWNGNRRRN